MDKPGDMAHAALLQAWQASGADRVDPVRFRYIEAMVRRTTAQPDAARRVLDARIATLLAGYAEVVAHAPQQHSSASAAAPQPGPLSALTETLARHAAAQVDHDLPAGLGLPPSLSGPAELKSAQYFRSTWSRLSAQKRLTESLAQLPENAGPLNSHRLVHRAMSLMHGLSPEYLQKFMAHVDALMWLDRAQAASAPVSRGAGKDSAKGKVVARSSKKPRGK